MIVKCSKCGADIEKKPSLVKRQKNFFCSTKCQSEFRKKGREQPCGNGCGEMVYRPPSELKKSASGLVFCSKSCANSYSNRTARLGRDHPNYVNGEWSYRRTALREHGEQCQNPACEIRAAGIAIPVYMLDVHHVNGDRKNNQLYNLQVLCVWCHVKKTRQDVA